MTIEEIWKQIEESFTVAIIKAFAEKDMEKQIWIEPRQCGDIVIWCDGQCDICDRHNYISPISTSTAEYVKVIRCKNCKYRDDEGTCYGRGSPYQFVPDDGYCDKGKERESDGKNKL